MLRNFITTLILLLPCTVHAQEMRSTADRIRKQYQIPELCYAVISSDSIYEMQAFGTRKRGADLPATLNDRFRIGSNTKAITGFIAALLVKQGQLSWNTKFFDLFPELKAQSRKEYWNVTLLDLLTFRAHLFAYTYTDKLPAKGQFTGSYSHQRYSFASWFFRQRPVITTDNISFSNLGYVAAGLMLEKVSNKSYSELVDDLGKRLAISFDFGQPNKKDLLQTWGHNNHLIPEPPIDDYKLNWLQAAGNINVTMPDYVKFIQLQLLGLRGRSDMLTQKEFGFLHYGRSEFAVGWFHETDSHGQQYSYNTGNPGTFLSKTYVFKDADRAFILFANVQTDAAEKGLTLLFEALKAKYD